MRYHQANDIVFLDKRPQVSTEARALTLRGTAQSPPQGLDGLPIDFYKSFQPEMGEDMLAVLSDSLAKGWFRLSCHRVVL